MVKPVVAGVWAAAVLFYLALAIYRPTATHAFCTHSSSQFGLPAYGCPVRAPHLPPLRVAAQHFTRAYLGKDYPFPVVVNYPPATRDAG